jgi:hypothetical protein
VSNKKTGLGKSAFFSRPESDEQESQTPPPQQPKKPEKPQKVRTTVTLYPETLASIELLKLEARKQSGEKVTYSDILHEAIETLMHQKGLSLE